MRTPLLERLYIDMPWIDVMANDAFIMAIVQHPVSLERLRAAAYRVQDKLVLQADWSRAWNQFLQKRPEFDGGSYGNQMLVFGGLQLGALPTVENFEEIADRTPCPLAVSTKHVEQQREQVERRRLIQKITEGKTVYTARDRYGVVNREPTADLKNETTNAFKKSTICRTAAAVLRMNPRAAREEVSRIRKDQPVTEAPDVPLINEKTGLTFTRSELLQMVRNQTRRLSVAFYIRRTGSLSLGARTP